MTRDQYVNLLQQRRQSIFEEFQLSYQMHQGVPAGWVCPLTDGGVELVKAFAKAYRYEDLGVLEDYLNLEAAVSEPDVSDTLRFIAEAPPQLHWSPLESDRSLLMRELAGELLQGGPPSSDPSG